MLHRTQVSVVDQRPQELLAAAATGIRVRYAAGLGAAPTATRCARQSRACRSTTRSSTPVRALALVPLGAGEPGSSPGPFVAAAVLLTLHAVMIMSRLVIQSARADVPKQCGSSAGVHLHHPLTSTFPSTPHGTLPQLAL